MPRSTPYPTRQANRSRRSIWRRLLTSGVLALSLGIPVLDNPLTLPAAHAHHGGGGAGSGGAGSGGGGGGSGKDNKFTKPGNARTAPDHGYGKGGRGSEGMKP